jgi:hypothetical protein
MSMVEGNGTVTCLMSESGIYGGGGGPGTTDSLAAGLWSAGRCGLGVNQRVLKADPIDEEETAGGIGSLHSACQVRSMRSL